MNVLTDTVVYVFLSKYVKMPSMSPGVALAVFLTCFGFIAAYILWMLWDVELRKKWRWYRYRALERKQK